MIFTCRTCAATFETRMLLYDHKRETRHISSYNLAKLEAPEEITNNETPMRAIEEAPSCNCASALCEFHEGNAW